MSEGPMPPDRPTDDPPNDGDARDERLAALLEVPPLDDVTRRRLVRRALDEPRAVPERGRHVLVAIAAAAAVVVGALGTVAVLREGGGDTTPAGRDRTEKTAEPAAGDADEEAAAEPTALGDLGEVSDPAVLRDQLTQPAAAPAPPAESEGGVAGCTFMTGDFGTTGVPTVFAIGTYQGAPAFVYVITKGGIDTAFVVDAATCELRSEVPLV